MYTSGSVVSDCGKYLHVYVREACQDCLWFYVPLTGEPITGAFQLIPIVEVFNAEYDYVTNDGDICYVRTNKNAPNFRLVKIDLKNPSEVT
jgi:prolyl oligopeptidase